MSDDGRPMAAAWYLANLGGMVAYGVVVASPVTLFVTVTLQVTIDPPAFAELLHWFTDPTSAVVDTAGRCTHVVLPGAPVQTVVVTVELVTPVATSRLFTTVTSQRTSAAAPVSA